MTNDHTPNQERLTPMQVCEALIGKPEAVSAAAGLAPKASYGWRHASGDRDPGDIPSPRHMRRLLAFARAQGIPLEARHLIEGATRAEVDALLASLRGIAA